MQNAAAVGLAAGADRRVSVRVLVGGALAGWAGLIVGAHLWGNALNGAGVRILLGAPPLFGQWDLDLGPGVLPAVGVAAAVTLLAPSLAATLRWRPLLGTAALAALTWAVALALTEGPDGIHVPLQGPSDYLASVPAVGSPGEFLSTFTDRIDGYATHVRSHPPGMVLALWGLGELGLGGSWPAAVLILLIAASAVPAVLIATRAVAGESVARRAAPFVVLAPGAVWIATTADALFMGVGAWAVALTILAIKARGARADLLAAGGGIVFGLAIFLSAGLALLAAIPLGVAAAAGRLRPLAVTALGAGSVVLAFAAAGYWWFDGFAAIREQYAGSVASTRPYDFFLLANLAAFALAAGPATAAGLALLRHRATWLLVGGALVAVLLADLSGMSKAEVERIWLPFLPWVLIAAVALPRGRRVRRAALGAQAGLAIAIQVGVAMIW